MCARLCYLYVDPLCLKQKKSNWKHEINKIGLQLSRTTNNNSNSNNNMNSPSMKRSDNNSNKSSE